MGVLIQAARRVLALVEAVRHKRASKHTVAIPATGRLRSGSSGHRRADLSLSLALAYLDCCTVGELAARYDNRLKASLPRRGVLDSRRITFS